MSRSACWPGTPQENARRGRPVVEPAGLGSDLIAVSPLAADPVARPLPGGGSCGSLVVTRIALAGPVVEGGARCCSLCCWPPKRVGSDSRQRRLDRRRSGSTGGGAGLSGTASRFAIIRELGLAITPPARAAPARISSEPHARSGWLGPNVERHDQTGQRMLRTRTSLVAVVALCLLLASCSGAASGHSKPTTNSSVTSPPASSTGMAAQPGAGRICGRVAKPPTTWAHVIWIWMENHDYADLVGNPQAPYENNALIGGCGLAANYHNITHPSLPNYLAATSGHPQVDSDCSPSACATTSPSLFDQLREAGKTWRAYEESMPANCAAHDTGAYAARHNPAVYYRPIAGDCARWDQPMGTT